MFLLEISNNCGCRATTPTNTIQLDAQWLPDLSQSRRGGRQGRQPLDNYHLPKRFPNRLNADMVRKYHADVANYAEPPHQNAAGAVRSDPTRRATR